ncbi:ABC transporter permease [Chitinimonas lacunae]|uniref:ABC transporter permease n=1 Tax=Chitinimonas lacunae TaxID=1963018 RepID=A0ABV8MNV8_9NEIS
MLMTTMLGEAWSAMRANRLRTFLTMLGMVIGVAAVVLMLAVGQGAREAVRRSIDSMGSHLFVVLAGSSNVGGVRSGGGGASTLTIDDAEALAGLPGVALSAPVVSGGAQLVAGANNWNTQVLGSTADYLAIRGWEVARGDGFDPGDIRTGNRVALLGATVAENLFGERDPIGLTLRIRQSPFTVIGVLARKGQSLDGRDQDDTVLVPISAAQRNLFGSRFRGSVRMVLVQAESDQAMATVEPAMAELLRQRHRLREDADDDFSIANLTAVANSAAAMARTMSLLLGAIASVSLLVGGIGIMNIMLVSVTERTREIGIRIAIGARQRDVLLQFLLEAIAMSLAGCLIGVGVGVGGALVAQHWFEVAIALSGGAVALAFGVAGFTGVFFGFYPALKAAQLDPIEALRYQ